MPITFVNDQVNPGRDGELATSTTVNKPTGVVSGDFLIAFIHCSLNTATINTPSGWTQHMDFTSGSWFRGKIFYKIAGGSEPSSYTWTFNSPSTYWGSEYIAAYRGVNTTSPITTSNNADIVSGGTVHSSGSITTSSYQYVMHFAGGTHPNSLSWDTTYDVEREDYTLKRDSNGQWTSVAWWDDGLLPPGTYSRTHTSSDVVSYGRGGIIALQPISYDWTQDFSDAVALSDPMHKWHPGFQANYRRVVHVGYTP